MASITFHGAARQVTGSCHLLESPATGKLLLDCGMHQGGDQVSRSADEAFDFDPSDIDGVVLSHAHLDHSGLLPLLVHQGFSGPIYCTQATALLLRVMLEDAANIYERDLEYENLRRRRRGDDIIKPVYTHEDVLKVFKQCIPTGYRQSVSINKAKLTFHDAGHILGSAIIEISFPDDGKDKTLVFSGDLGKRHSALMNDPALLSKADIVLMEGTYGNRDHRSLSDSLTQLESILRDTWQAKGNIMIPAFAVGRTQEILFHLGCMAAEGKLDGWQVFLDSPMAIEVTGLYQNCMNLLAPEDVTKIKKGYDSTLKSFLPNLHFTSSVEESMAINRISHGAIIIAGSGMCTGGRIRHHFKQRIWNQRNTVVFTGFQARGTLGRKLVDGAGKIHMFGSDFAIRARIETLNGFSAHASQQELTQWVGNFTSDPQVVLVHGEEESLQVLAKHLQQTHQIDAKIPSLGDTLRF